MARNAIVREESVEEEYSRLPARPPREAWVGRMRYIVVPVIAVLAVAAAIYVLDDSKTPPADVQLGGATAVNVPTFGVRGPAPRVGFPAPDFAVGGLDGKPVKLSDFRGNAVFLNFFASWCPPCRAEMPDIVALYNEQKANNVVVLGVDMQEEASVVRNYAMAAGMTFPIALDRTGEVADAYRITAIPTSYFIDKDGVVRDMQIGPMSKTIMLNRLNKAM